MAYPVWPTAFGNPDASYDGSLFLPLVSGDRESIGAFKTDRQWTRPVVSGNIKMLMTAAQFDAFRAFWKNDLNRGTTFFTATWFALLGYEGYMGKIPTYTMGAQGVLPEVSLELELHPWVSLDAGDPSPWPAP